MSGSFVCVRENLDPLGALHGVPGPFEFRSSPEPLPDTDGWLCGFFPSQEDLGWSWDVERSARDIWKLVRLFREVPL